MSSWTCISGSWREPLLFESFLQVGQLSLLKEVEEFLAAGAAAGPRLGEPSRQRLSHTADGIRQVSVVSTSNWHSRGLDIFSAPEYGGAKFIGNRKVKSIAAINLRR
jgi:hypothetical protein